VLRAFFGSFRSERLKLRRSLLGWLIVLGGSFVPVIMLAVRIKRREQMFAMHQAGVFWEKHWTESWESISIMMLPLLVVLVTTLILQVEYRNNTWKQVHASPQAWVTIFSAKLAVTLVALVEIFVVINAGLYVAGALPSLLLGGAGPSTSPIPFALLATRNAVYLVECLPIVAIQFLLALRFRNFLVPVGVGAAGWIFSLVLINTRFNYLVPYNYTGIDYLVSTGHRTSQNLPASLWVLSCGAFVVITLASYVIYSRREDKG
jgi:lantibiotic transport system permease protein